MKDAAGTGRIGKQRFVSVTRRAPSHLGFAILPYSRREAAFGKTLSGSRRCEGGRFLGTLRSVAESGEPGGGLARGRSYNEAPFSSHAKEPMDTPAHDYGRALSVDAEAIG